MKKRIAVATLGCKVNQFESASFVSGFQGADCLMVPFSSRADVYVINTCAVTSRAGQQSRQLIRRARRANPDARIIVTGCYAQIAGEELLGMLDNPPWIIGNGNKHLLVEAALGDSRSDLVMLTGNIGLKKEICPLPVRRFSGRTRAYLRVQDGCNNFCSYCIVPYSRGRSRSLPISMVHEQVEQFEKEGYREIVVTGINVGKYGLDLNEGVAIHSLLDTLCRTYPNLRIRLSSIEPTEVDEQLMEVITRHNNFMPHLHIPLQSGDNRILALMNRRYTAELFVEVIGKITRALPKAAIGCDILAGFPGEGEAAANNTLSLLSDLPVTYLHVFPYSSRPGTLAATLKRQVSGKDKEDRVGRLRKLDREKRQDFYRNHLGSIQQVLVERRNKKSGLLQGFSEYYIPLQFEGPAQHIGQVVAVRFNRLDNGQPLGTLGIEQDGLEFSTGTL